MSTQVYAFNLVLLTPIWSWSIFKHFWHNYSNNFKKQFSLTSGWHTLSHLWTSQESRKLHLLDFCIIHIRFLSSCQSSPQFLIQLVSKKYSFKYVCSFKVLLSFSRWEDDHIHGYLEKTHMVCCQAYQISIIKYRKQSYWGEKFETRQRIFKY